MKVAILTQPLGHNYGGLLQAYALQTYLKKIGCGVETLDRPMPKGSNIIACKAYIKNLIKLLLGRIKAIPTSKKKSYIQRELADFRDNRLEMSPTIFSEAELREYYRSKSFDAFVVGSDQVWRPRYSPSILNFYFDFLDDIQSEAKRLAYAASFGVDDWEYTNEVTKRCEQLIQQFDAVSVRESTAVNLCADKFGVQAKMVVDPTLLLEPADYKSLISQCDENINAGCVLAYVLDVAPEKRMVAKTVGSWLDVDVFSIKPEVTISQVPHKEIHKCDYPSVEKWVQAFHDASFIVTDSFHGTVFSIIFNKPFIAIGNSKRGTTRFDSLLSKFDLNDRLVDSVKDLTPELVNQKIDWNAVNEKRAALSEEGKSFLTTNLLGK